MNITELIGKTLTSIKQTEREVIFFANDGVEYKMYHNQNCCEDVYVDDIVGDLKDLIGVPILKASEESNCESPKKRNTSTDPEDDYINESFTWTFYHLATIKGYVTIKWYGSSNGCYSERVDFVQIGTEDEYGYFPD